MARLFLWIAPFVFAAFALLTPPFQTPDEHQHLFRAWQLAEGHLLGERRGNQAGAVLPGGLGVAASAEIGSLDPHVDRPVPQRPWNGRLHTDIHAETPHFYNFVGSVIYAPVGYVPQVAAVHIGRSADLSVENIVRLGRLFNAALAIVLIALAISIAPLGKNVFLTTGLLPITASASASMGQDGMVIGTSLLLTAWSLQALDRRGWTPSRALAVTALALVTTLAKFLYLPLALVGAAAITRTRKARSLVLPALACGLAGAVAGLWVYSTRDLVVPFRTDLPDVASRLSDLATDPLHILRLFWNTFLVGGPHLFHTAFTFGWLNVGPVLGAELLSILAAAYLLLAGEPALSQLGVSVRLWLLSIGLSVILLISAVLLFSWTPPKSDIVVGLQARYFLPVLPVLLLPFVPSRPRFAEGGKYVPYLLIGANVAALITIVRGYYLF